MCELRLCTRLCIADAFKIYHHAHMFNCPLLKIASQEYCVSNFELIENEEPASMQQLTNCPQLLLELSRAVIYSRRGTKQNNKSSGLDGRSPKRQRRS